MTDDLSDPSDAPDVDATTPLSDLLDEIAHLEALQAQLAERATTTKAAAESVKNLKLAQLTPAFNPLIPDLPEFARHLVPGFRSPPHLRYLMQRVSRAEEDMRRGLSRRIIVTMPPRAGKSLLSSQIIPAWLLARNPAIQIALTSYSAQLATSWGRSIRRWVEEGKLPGVTIPRDAGAVGLWQTTAGGQVLSASIGQALTGFGANVLIVDDPHKGFAEAHSEVQRNAVWDWFQSVAQTRINPGPSLILVVNTRWHESDLVGRILGTAAKNFPT